MSVEPEQNINSRIATRVRALRLSKGIKVEDLARMLGVKLNLITRIENGHSTMSAAQLVRMAQALGVLASHIVGDIPANRENVNG